MMEWEIAACLGEDDWHALGSADGSSPVAALRSWTGRHGREHERYGVRSPGADVWQPFVFDAMGEPEASDVID